MHVISRKKLVEFWTKHPAAESPLRVWFRRVRRAQWTTFAELRATFPTADQVRRMIVINIGGNRFRLIAASHFNRGKVYIRHVLTHADYDRGDSRFSLRTCPRITPCFEQHQLEA